MPTYVVKASLVLGIVSICIYPLSVPAAQAAQFAVQAGERALCCTPLEQINTHLELLTLYLKQGDTAAAQQALFNAQVLLQNHFPGVASQRDYWVQVASAHSSLGQFSSAFAIYERLYRAYPEAFYALRLGQLALQLNHQKDAQSWLTVAHRLFPLDSFPPVLASNLWAAGLYPAAALRLESLSAGADLTARLSASAQADNRLRLADIYLQQKALARAQNLVRNTRLELVSLDLQPVLASVYLRLGRFEEAVSLYEKLLRTEAQNPRYLLALANALAQQESVEDLPRIQQLLAQGFDLSVARPETLNLSDSFWRSLFFGLSDVGELWRAEQAFLQVTEPTVADVLQAAFLAQQRGEASQAQLRFQQVVERLPLRPNTPLALQQRWQAEWALLSQHSQGIEDPRVFQEHQADASRRWQAVFAQELLQSTPAGRLLLIESALALGTPEVLSQAETLLSPTPVWPSRSDNNAQLQLRQAELELRQRPAAAPVRFEALFQSNVQAPHTLSLTERADLARGLTAVQKPQAAEQIWKSLVEDQDPGEAQIPKRQWLLQWQLERLHNTLQRYPRHSAQTEIVRQSLQEMMARWPVQADPLTLLRRAQLAFSLTDYALARADFTQVLAHWPGNLIARQGLALSLLNLQRYGLAYEAFLVLQSWGDPQGVLYQDASLRLAQIEQVWGYPQRAFQRAALLQALQTSPLTQEIAIAAEQWQDTLFSDRWGFSRPLAPLRPLGLHELTYAGELAGSLQDVFIGDTYTRYGLMSTDHTLSWAHPQADSGRLSPALQQQLTLEATRYQRLGEGGRDSFSFQRGGVRWAQHWRHESPTGPLHYWLRPALAYRWGIPEPFSIGVNQHGHAELEMGVQWDRHQALEWEGDLKFGQAELFLGSFYNYGSVLRWRWRDTLVDVWGDVSGTWGATLGLGLQNYLVLDGNGAQQNLFRQLNGVDLSYQDKTWEYAGHFDVSPIYGTLSDINLNTSHHVQQALSSAWGMEYRVEAHHYYQPVQRFQNQWRVQSGVVYHFPTPLQHPLSLAFGVGLNHFYSTGFVPAPQLYFSLRTGR